MKSVFKVIISIIIAIGILYSRNILFNSINLLFYRINPSYLQ